uniref:Uncharacterized protein n=1 Tax=Rhizophora mucronata TaxID=61149 RepID=A0A2P2PVG7_RHIMU
MGMGLLASLLFLSISPPPWLPANR